MFRIDSDPQSHARGAAARRASTGLWAVLAAALGWLFATPAVICAQDPFLLADPSFEESESDETIRRTQATTRPSRSEPQLIPSERTRRRNVDGAGIEGRFGHIAFPTFGRDDSITHLELFPYVQRGNELFFSDVRLFLSNEGYYGGNFGVGFRHLDDDHGVVWGGNLFYDADETTGELFQQVGFGLETIGETLAGRANVYVPIGDTSLNFPRRIVNQRFSGMQLLFDVVQPVGEAMTGVDVEWEAAVPGEWAREHALRLFVGGYFFHDSDVSDIFGGKAGGQVFLLDHVAAHTEVTHDDAFGTNAVLGVTLYFPGGRLDKTWNRPEQRLKDYVRRNYNVIVDRRPVYTDDVVAAAPGTGTPLVFAHADSTAAGPGTGTATDPFSTLASAIGSGADVVFAHADSIFTETVTLGAGQQLFGEGVGHSITVDRYGSITLPTATAGLNRPAIRNAPGDAVTLADGSALSGFVIEDPTGNGVVLNAIASADVTQTDILGAAGDGLRVVDVTGDVLLEDLLIRDAGNIALFVDNLSGSLTATGTTTIEDAAVGGLWIEDSSGDALFEDLLVDNRGTAGSGVELRDNIGTTTLERIDLTTSGGAGLLARDGGSLTVQEGEITSTAAAAIDVEDTTIDLILNRIRSDGGAEGIRLVDTPGRLTLLGGNNLGSGGFITNKTTGVLLEDAGVVFLNGLDFDANGVALQSTGGEAVGLNGARIANTAGLAIDSLNDELLQISQSVLGANGAAGVGTIRHRADAVGDYDLILVGNQIDDDDGNAVEVLSEAGAAGSTLNLLARENDIQHDADNSIGLSIDWNGPLTASLSNNDFGSAGDGARGVLLNAASTTDAATVVIDRNDFLYSGGNIVGTEITSEAPLTLTYSRTLGIFTGANAVGLEGTFNEVVNANLSGNRIEHQGGGGTTILVNDAAGGSGFTISNNLFIFPDNGAIVERGIIFSNVTGGVINLFGNADNRILDGTQPFFAPAGDTLGTISVNGTPMP